jgi:hypothetical protein
MPSSSLNVKTKSSFFSQSGEQRNADLYFLSRDVGTSSHEITVVKTFSFDSVYSGIQVLNPPVPIAVPYI